MPHPIQRLLAAVAAVMTFPLTAVLALLVRLDSPGPALYRAVRMGRGGRPFVCLKLRSMAAGAAGPGITTASDRRVTRLGGLLRRTRLDELPQLWNVVRGEMALVGPRPEDPAFVDEADARWRTVLDVRPGITGITQLLHRDEASMLDTDDPERHYRQVILPGKLALDAAYVRHRSAGLDLWILAQTPLVLLGREPHVPGSIRADLVDA